jgi:hypothetical protein
MIQREQLSADDMVRVEAADGWLPVGILCDLSATCRPAADVTDVADQSALVPGSDKPASGDAFAEMAAQAGLKTVQRQAKSEPQPVSKNLDDIFDDVMSSPVPKTPQPASDSVPSDKTDDLFDPVDEQDKPTEPAIAAAAPSPIPAAMPSKPKPVSPPRIQPNRKQAGSSAGRRSLLSGIELNPKLLIPLGIGLVVFLYMYVPWGSGADKENYMTLIGFCDEFRQHRERKATPAEWKALETRVLAETEPMSIDLNKRGGARNRISQHMLFAARDFLPNMFKTAQQKPDEEERQFNEQMESARKLMGIKSLPP